MMNEKFIDKINSYGDHNHLSITLGSNKLAFAQNQRWIMVDSDLDVASAEILRLTEENEQLRMANSEISNRLSSSVKENMEMSRLNSVTMELLTEERRKSLILEQEVSAYKKELKKSFGTIVELRKHINSDNQSDLS